MQDTGMTVEEQIMGQLPCGDTAVNVFAVYDAVDADPAAFTDALRRLQDQGDVFKPKRWHLQRI